MSVTQLEHFTDIVECKRLGGKIPELPTLDLVSSAGLLGPSKSSVTDSQLEVPENFPTISSLGL